MKSLKYSLAAVFLWVLCIPITAQAVPASSLDEVVSEYFSKLASYRYRASRQAFIFETLEGETLVEHNADHASDPASIIKAVTTLTALTKLGPDYRFATSFHLTGPVDYETQTLKGDLVVTGSGDPSFYYENAFYVASALNQRGITRVEGDLIIGGTFYFNFTASPSTSARYFKAALNPKTWTRSMRRAWAEYTQKLNSAGQAVGAPAQVEITGRVRRGSPPPGELLFAHLSNPITHILKELNKYSNNTMAELVGRKFGGPRAIQRYLLEELKLNPAQVRIASASGLNRGYLTPRDTIKIYRELLAVLTRHNLRLEDVLPVVGIDEGTLSERLNNDLAACLTGKTGTLTRSGVSTLAGVVYTKAKGAVLFAIFNRGGNVHRFRQAQDNFLARFIDYYGGGAPVAYHPPTNFIHTADCRLRWNVEAAAAAGTQVQ